MARIGIDIRKLKDYGIGTYIQNLLAGIEVEDKENDYVLFHRPDEDITSLPSGMEKVPEKAGLYSLREPFSLGKSARRARLDLLHCPHYVVPYRPGCRLAVTIHDLIHLLFPEHLPGKMARYYAAYFLKRAARKADVIFTVSESSRRDILKHLPAKEEQVVTVYNAVDPLFSKAVDAGRLKAVRGKYRLSTPYVLYVGNDKRHKNLENAIKAFRLFHQTDGSGWTFVLAGGTFEDPVIGASILRQVEESQLADAVVFLGFIPKEDLAVVYAGADIFLFPSLYEGFGLPPLEAMAAGVPVVSSDRSAMPEVLGDAAVLTDPTVPNRMSDAMRGLVSQQQLRDEMIQKGKKQAAKFTWSETVRKTLAGYRKALEAA